MAKSNITISAENLLSQAEAAGELGITTMTLWRWIKRGKIIAIKLGRYTLIPASEIKRIKPNL